MQIDCAIFMIFEGTQFKLYFILYVHIEKNANRLCNVHEICLFIVSLVGNLGNHFEKYLKLDSTIYNQSWAIFNTYNISRTIFENIHVYPKLYESWSKHAQSSSVGTNLFTCQVVILRHLSRFCANSIAVSKLWNPISFSWLKLAE